MSERDEPSPSEELGITRPGTPAVAQGLEPLETQSRWVVAGRYEILGLLGSGGMGTVYRARDRELDETVALKMLKRQIASSKGILERFRREVKLARRVTHRNVARTFDIGEYPGGKFLTMELIDGTMLASYVAQKGRLRLHEIVRIGRELCFGLAAAHGAGVIHRDLKPENVIVAHDGRVVITDFGIARVLRAEEAARSAGGLVGTPNYMAPEQLEGALDLDARTDIYALGTILFELFAGGPAWDAETPLRAAMARLTQPPPDLRDVVPQISDVAARIVKRCMARDRNERFESAEHVAAALELLGGTESTPAVGPPRAPTRAVPRTTLAVLPLVNAGDHDEDYLAGTMTEDLVDLLSAVPEVHVRAHGVVIHAAGSTDDPIATGQTLGVDAIVAGTLKRTGDSVLVTFRLLTVEDGFQLWARRFECAVAEAVAIADEAASDIAQALTIKANTARRPLPTHPVAHDLYLRGRYAYHRGWFDERGEAVRLLREAHGLAPNDAVIAATYARALARAYGIHSLGEPTALLAREAAEKALAIDPERLEARLALATIHLYRGDGIGAVEELRRARAMDPNDADVLDALGRLRAEVGPLDVARERLEAALSRNPALPDARATLARVAQLEGDFKGALATLGPRPPHRVELVPYLLNYSRMLLWQRDKVLAAALLAELPVMEEAVSSVKDTMELVLRVTVNERLDEKDRALLERSFPSGTKISTRRAAFNAQLRTEVYLVANEEEHAIEALLDAAANGFIDVEWLVRCVLLDKVRDRSELRGVRRSTSLRAARIREALDAP